MFIRRLLNKLLQDVQQTKKAYYTQVERACNAALQDLRVETEEGNEHKVLRQKSVEYEQAQDSDNLDLLVGEEVRPQTSVDTEKFFLPFELACKGDVAKITITALDGLQKLIAYGEIIGDYPDPKTPTRRLIDRIVETICSCNSVDECDEGVELQIIKALLTIVTSEQVQVHESVLLLILRTCCIIHLTTKSIVNKRTARAMLTQMLHSIFQRMEVSTEELEMEESKSGNTVESMSDVDEFSDFQEWDAECISLVGEHFYHFVLSGSDTLSRNAKSSPDLRRDINQNSEAHTTQSTLNSNCDTNPHDGKVDVPQVSDEREFMASPEDALNPFLNEAGLSLSSNGTSTTASILMKDAFLSFWTMTKLAVKPILRSSAENETEKSSQDTRFQQSTLAFHLLKEILERSGRAFKDSSIFINAMRQHLFNAIKDSGISQNLEVFKLEVEILMIIMKKFHDVLSEEIIDLWDVLIFPAFQLPNAHPQPFPTDCSKIVLNCLKTISIDLNCFVNFFTAYDCNPDVKTRPFQNLVQCLNKIICEKHGNEEIAIEVVTNLLKSMSAACPKLEDSSHEVERQSPKECDSADFSDDSVISKLEIEGTDFLTCLHIFLANVEIPCGVIQLDWYVQKLAQRMMDTSSVNSLRTETADCWYALVYASLTLIADIRITNCQGKSKMSRSQFRKLNRGINGCEPLDDAYLSTIYDEIEENYAKDCSGTSPPSSQPRWLDMVGKNENEILDVIKYILECSSLLRSHFSLGKQLKHVKRMIKACGTTFLMALINALQNTNDTKLSDVCLDGIHSGIRVACILGLDNEREVYVQALAKMSVAALEEIRGKSINSKIVTKKTSTLTMTENGVTKTVVTTTTEMKCRSVDIILTLLDVGITEGNHLGGSWLPILKFMSQLLSTPILLESRNSSRSSSPVPPAEPVGGNGGWAAWAGSLRESLEKKLWDPTAKSLHPSVKESIANSVERVFKRSEMLTGDAMTDFFQALCQVALHDMMNSDTTKHLMYEKINDVADRNFYRPALQWSQIWQVVSDYFCHLACSSKEEISTLAIESIQKLVLKLLNKETLNGYRFQNHYLSPFKVIIANTRSETTREAVLGFIDTVISLHGDLLLSGWIAIFSILVANISSHNCETDAASDSFKVLQHIVDKCQKSEVNLRNSFGSIVKSLIDIASSVAPTLEMSEKAFRLLTQLAEIPYRQPKLLMEENDNKSYRVWSRGWKPILHELSLIIVDNKHSTSSKNCEIIGNGIDCNGDSISISWDIKTKALITLFEVIKNYGDSFEKDWWSSVFDILFNIFNNIKFHEKQDIMASSTSTELAPSSSSPPQPPPPSTSDGNYKYFYCYYYVQFAIFDVYIQYYDATGSYVFEELLKHLQWCICQDHEQIALSGLSCLQQLVTSLDRRFSVTQWDSILNVFETIGQSMENDKIVTNKLGNEQDYENLQSPAIRAIVHLELLKIIEKIIFPRRKSSLTSMPQKDDNVTVDDALQCIDKLNDTLNDGQVSRILELLVRSHEISKEQCIHSTSQEADSSTDLSQCKGSNFIPHETLSLQIYWRILFGMLREGAVPALLTKDSVWQMILNSCIQSCSYFVTIQLHEHRDAWTDLLCFGLDSILRLPQSYFEQMTNQLYPYFCEMMELDLLDRKICDTLRAFLLVIGRNYAIISTLDERSLAIPDVSLFDGSDIVPKSMNNNTEVEAPAQRS